MRCSSRGRGEAVLLIHGMPTNGRLWDDVVGELSRCYRCFVVDLPGMQGTPFLPYGPSYFAQLTEQVEQVRIRNHVRRWHVVGHDGGAAIAVQYAHSFPQRVGCLALLSPAVFGDLRPPFPLNLLRQPIVGEILAPFVHMLFWHVIMRRAISDIRNAAQRASFHDEFAGVSGPWRLMQLVRWGNPETVFKDFPRIMRGLTCPTLLIHGSRDVLPESFAYRAAHLIPHAQFMAVDSGHFIPIEQAIQVSDKLGELFRLYRRKNQNGRLPLERIAPPSTLTPQPFLAIS